MITNIALLGAGRIGKVHARAITSDPRAKLVAVADVSKEAAEAIASNYHCAVLGIDDILER